MVISIAVAMGLIISPESLIVLGNGIGNAGVYFIFSIAIAVIFYMPNVIGQSVATLAGGEVRLMKATLGPIASGASSLCSRVAFTICALPVLLSTAGFVLNETFLYWFPPFLFAHLLLIVLAALNIAHRKAAEVVQAVLVSLVLSGLLVLSVTGVTSSSITSTGGETLALSGIQGRFSTTELDACFESIGSGCSFCCCRNWFCIYRKICAQTGPVGSSGIGRAAVLAQ